MDRDSLVIRLGGSRIVFRRPAVYGADLLLSLRLTEEALLSALRHADKGFSIQDDLRTIYTEVVPGGASRGSFEHMAGQLGTAVSQGAVRAYLVQDIVTAAPAALAAVTPAATTPVPFVDDNGAPVLDPAGNQMQRPFGLTPGYIVAQGIADQKVEQEMILHGDGMTAAGYQMGALAKFKQGGPWDAQRIGGKFHPEFVDYATVLIGLYAGATGMPKAGILTVENDYAAVLSKYPPATVMDGTYTHLPARNVANTTTGYALLSSGRIRATSAPN
jgi:hypothetical protein